MKKMMSEITRIVRTGCSSAVLKRMLLVRESNRSIGYHHVSNFVRTSMGDRTNSGYTVGGEVERFSVGGRRQSDSGPRKFDAACSSVTPMGETEP
jgi:hypothetical protein